MRHKIIGFTGKMGAGKSACANLLSNLITEHNKEAQVKIFKFAQPLYDIQRYAYERINRDMKGEKDRKLLQFLGTDWGRSIDENLWVNLWRIEVRTYTFKYNYNYVINDDLRFDNEAEQVVAMGGVIFEVQAERDTREARIPLIQGDHLSEKGVTGKYITNSIDNNGTLGDLKGKLKELFHL